MVAGDSQGAGRRGRRRSDARGGGRGAVGAVAEADGADGVNLAALVEPVRDVELEMIVLGCVIVDARQSWPFVGGRVREDTFHDARHRRVFTALTEMMSCGVAVDITTLTSYIGPMIDAVGGPSYLLTLAERAPSSAYLEQYVNDLVRVATLRAMQNVSLNTLLAIRERPFEEACTVASEMSSAMLGLAKPESLTPVMDVVVEMFDVMARTAERGNSIAGRTYGLRCIDRRTGGAGGGQLVIIAARPAMGKTSFVVGAFIAAAREAKARGEAGVFVIATLEMPRVEIARRAVCQMARVSESVVRGGLVNQDQLNVLTTAGNTLSELPILIADSGVNPKLSTTTGLRATLDLARLKHGRVLGVCVDYLQLMSDDGTRARSNYSVEAEINAITKAAKQWAKEFDCPFLMLSQLNRDCEKRPNKRPMLADLRGSGGIEQDADVVMFIYRDEVYRKDSEDKGIAELIIAKQRSGAPGMERTRFLGEYTRFEDIAAEDDFSGTGTLAEEDAASRFQRTGTAYDDIPVAQDDGDSNDNADF